jgi:hypothetical protein
MISSFVFSLIAFFIVSTTTFIIISNQSKVNNMKNVLKDNKQYLLNSTSKQDKKVFDLVNEVNLKHKDLQFENKKTKDEFKKQTTNVDNKINNLDKVFNSYKNITTANFMGMNNRVSKEVSRIDETADKLKKTVDKNEIERIKKDNELLRIINANENDFKNFTINTYSQKVNQLGKQDNILDDKINSINSNILSAVIDSSNLSLDARSLITNDVQTKYANVNKSLNNFFGIEYESPFVSLYSSASAETNSSNNFDVWFNSNYKFNQYVNFKSMKEMISSTNMNIDSVTLLKADVDILKTSNQLITDKLSNNSNLYKDNFYDFMNERYNFDVNSLVDIANNTDKINLLNSNIESLSNTLNSIGIFDVTVEGTITLDNLHQSIMSNQIQIDTNSNLISQKFDKEFGKYLEQNIIPNSVYITSNLDQSTLLEKLYNTKLKTSSVLTDNIVLKDDMLINGNSLSNTMEENLGRMNTFDTVFNFGGYGFKGLYKPVNVDNTQQKTMMTFINDPDETQKRLNYVQHLPRQIRVNPGVNMYLQRDKFKSEDSQGNIGGRLFVDSFDDIGIADRNPAYKLTENLENNKYMNASFKLDENDQSPRTLGNALSNLGKRIDDNKKEIESVQTNNITKKQLYNTIHNDNIQGGYDNQNIGGGYGKYGDNEKNSFRIDNLYTGSFGGSDSCQDGEYMNDNRCKTVNERLSSLEVSNSPQDQNNIDYGKFTMHMQNYGGGQENINGYDIGKTHHEKIIVNHKLTEVNKLNVKNDSIINGNLSVNGSVYLGNTGSALYLKEGVDDLRKINTDGTHQSIFNDYAKIEDNYITNLNISGNELVFDKSSSEGVIKGNISLPPNTSITKSPTNNDWSIVYNIEDDKEDMKQIYNPKKFSYVTFNSDEKKLKLQQIINGENRDDPTEVQIPSIDRNTLLTELAESTPGENIKPYFPTGIKLGDGCIKVAKGQLQICDANCDSASCEVVWDHGQAPEPVTSR